ncbi:Vegetative incompatibility protein [Alternaria gaisen]|uniref:Vegetative incompatibility protein n=1 Tax=Alternaria gaisen TaxID=167740 RepID=A0ACB6FCF5_9PLEO|nr:Vegetative incompatibility protein [Alternaria gaisen]
MPHIRGKYDHAGKALFEDANAWVALSKIFISMTQDKGLKRTYLVVDALDECVVDLPKLLDLIVLTSTLSARIKWLVSSRNENYIEEKLKLVSDEAKLSLELKQNAEQVARAVDAYIDHKLSCLESLGEAGLQNQVRDELRWKANGTFLWVALVMQELEKPESWDPLAVVEEAPAGLQQLYDRMMQQIQRLSARNVEICQSLLCITAVVYRPLYLAESAKDYLSDKMRSAALSSESKVHYTLFAQSLELLSNRLKRDMYSLVELGCSIDEVRVPDRDLLATARYPPTGSLVRQLFKHEELEAISIRPTLSEEWSACLQTLEGYSSTVSSVAFSHDSTRLTSASYDNTVKIWDASTGACVQTLEGHSSSVSSVAFSHDSTRLASASRDNTVKIWDASTGACVQTLEGHSRGVNSVVFSHDSTRLVSASYDSTVKIWDASTGACVQTLEGHSREVTSVVFSHDSTRLASASDDSTVKIWDASTGACVQTLEGHSCGVYSVVFSHDSTRLASASRDNTVKMWDASTGACLHTLKGYSNAVSSVAFSHDSTRLVSASDDNTVKIWDASSGACVQTLEGYSDYVYSVVFSHDSTRLASASRDNTVKI